MSSSTHSESTQPTDGGVTPTASGQPRTKLPSPDERPESLVLIYDGQCRFCTGQVERIHRWDWRKRVSFLSLHDPVVRERYPDLTHDKLMEEMVLIDQAGNRHGGAAAFRYLTLVIPGFYLLAPIMHIPFSLPIWSWFYRQVAKRRYMFGKVEDCDGSCEIHFK